MKIKRYAAVSMRAALALVRAEQGPDAVILSSRRGEDGIEVIAAVDYDEALFVEANRQRASAVSPQAPTPAPAASPEPIVAQPRAQPAATNPPPSGAQPAATQDQPRSRAQPAATQNPPPSRAAQTPPTAPRPPTSAPKLIPAHFRRMTVSSLPDIAPASAKPPAATRPAAPARAPASASATAPAATGASVGARMPAQAARPNLGLMQRELQDMRQLLETGLAGMTWNDKRVREPLKSRVLEELTAMDIAPDVAMALAAFTPQRTSLDNRSLISLALLVKHLPVVNDLGGGVSGGIMAVVGPTGAGKTTTIAKLAARWCMQHGSQDLALVSTDGYRIGARDQLMTYARVLGAPVHSANSGMELARVLERLKSKKLVLIDTAGMGPRDVRLTEQLAALQLGAARARVLLALPAQGEGHALDEIVQAFARVAPEACVITKVDEAASLGAVISTTMRHKMKIAYVCDGQRVPEDLHAAHQKRVWLVRAALNLKAAAPPRDDAYFVRNFGRASTHA
jgi:flagellar biosynthesis protein FlhF